MIPSCQYRSNYRFRRKKLQGHLNATRGTLFRHANGEESVPLILHQFAYKSTDFFSNSCTTLRKFSKLGFLNWHRSAKSEFTRWSRDHKSSRKNYFGSRNFISFLADFSSDICLTDISLIGISSTDNAEADVSLISISLTDISIADRRPIFRRLWFCLR